MATGKAPRPGLTVRGARLGPDLPAGAATAGCAPSGSSGTRSAEAAVSASASPRTAPFEFEKVCARIVAYGSRTVLEGGTRGDHRPRGLFNGRYGVLRTVVVADRAVKRRQGADAVEQLTVRRAREGRADRYRTGGPSKGPRQ
ncbi:hypothetical protein ACWD5Q_03700 [Streptomyces sp. NPDC002513]